MSPRGASGVAIALAAFVALACAVPVARADNRHMLDRDLFAVHSTGDLAIDAGLVVGAPAALPSGMSTGVGAGVTRGCTCALAYGVRASWSTETASSMAWTVTQWDLRLRAVGVLRHRAGRGTIALRLGLGATIVHESRMRNQGMRAGLTGSALETHALAALPAGELEAVVALHLAGPWLATVAAGPSLELDSGALRGGWIAELGVGWQP